MKKIRLIAALCGLMTLPVSAQIEDDDQIVNLRPECMFGTEDSAADGQHRAPRRVGSQSTAPLKSYGVQKVPVVLVQFADTKFTVAETSDAVNRYYQLFCNGTKDGNRYTGHGSYGSIRDYFVEQSEGRFLPEFEVIGPVTLSKGYAYYGKDGASRDENYTLFTSESLRLAMEIKSDWSDFDNDNNSTVDMVFFVFAGLGQNFKDADTNFIWPKESTASTTINGTEFATSAVTCELRVRAKNADGTVKTTRPDGVGVFLHELSHALGLPDFYDINSREYGMDIWSIMDYGEYCNSGFHPVNYTAYERDFMGWRPLVELTEPCVLTILPFAEGGDGYKIVNAASENQYLIIENRQARGWDGMLGEHYGHGLQVTRVAYNATLWNRNRVNTYAGNLNPDSYQHMTIIAANDCYKGTNSAKDANEWYSTLAGNLFPGSTYNYNLTDDTTPYGGFSEGNLIHKPLRNITENEDGSITLCYCTNGKLDAPGMPEVSNIGSNEFTATWADVVNATHYAYELYCDQLPVRQGDTPTASLHLEDLEPGSNLELRIMAKADIPEDYIDSDWSQATEFSTLTDDIIFVPEGDRTVDVFTMSGMYVSHCYADQLNRLSLHRGIYVIRYSNGDSRRVLIR